MRRKKLLVVFLVVFTILLSSFGLYFYQMVNTPNVLVDKEERVLLIPTGSDFAYVQKVLHEGDYLQDLVSFSFYAKLKDYHKGVKPGRYVLKSDMTNKELVAMLQSGLQAPTRITFNSVRTAEDLAEKVTSTIELEAEELLNLLQDPRVAKNFGFDSASFYTMFLPDTYEVYWNISAEALLKRMKEEYERFWNDKRLARADSIGLTPKEVIVLASIVEAETKYNDESPRVAGVYMNRLKKGIALQADPTLIFALNDFTIKRVLNEHKDIPSPYNTYKYRGLPPGPINLPSKVNIDAVLNHEDHNYYYFCAKADFSGYHAFASTLAQHNRNAALYRRALNNARIYR